MFRSRKIERVKREVKSKRVNREVWDGRRRRESNQEWLRERIWFELAIRLNGERRYKIDMERKIVICNLYVKKKCVCKRRNTVMTIRSQGLH